MAASCVLRRNCSTAPSASMGWRRLWESRAGVWCRSLLSDYKEACREILVGARERPFKASLYTTLLGMTYACYRTNPDAASFQSRLLENSNKLALLSPWIRSGDSDAHVQDLVQLGNQGRLRHFSLGVFSLAYTAEHDPNCSLYEACCSALAPPWRELPARVLDVGFAGRWWLLERNMRDYDINEDQFKYLAPALLETVPPSPQETERNERLHRESWKAVVMEEEKEKV